MEWAKRAPFEALSRIYPGEYGAEGEIEIPCAKAKAVVGLALGFLLYEGGFVALAGEWFGMWQSASYDAVPSAFIPR